MCVGTLLLLLIESDQLRYLTHPTTYISTKSTLPNLLPAHVPCLTPSPFSCHVLARRVTSIRGQSTCLSTVRVSSNSIQDGKADTTISPVSPGAGSEVLGFSLGLSARRMLDNLTTTQDCPWRGWREESDDDGPVGFGQARQKASKSADHGGHGHERGCRPGSKRG